MHDDPTFVVSRAPPIETALPLDGLKRIGGPLGCGARGLHVVVGVEKEGGRTFGGGDLGEHRRVASVRRQQLGILEPGPIEYPDDRLRRLVHLVRVVTGGADRGKSDQVAEELGEPGKVGGHFCL